MSSKNMIAGAAIAGLLSGTCALAGASTQSSSGKTLAIAGTLIEKTAAAGEHACKGKNDCKGKGGCKSGDNGCKGKNSCKGKGGCSTMPKEPKK